MQLLNPLANFKGETTHTHRARREKQKGRERREEEKGRRKKNETREERKVGQGAGKVLNLSFES